MKTEAQKVQVNVWMDTKDRERIRRLADERGLSIGELVRSALLGESQRVDLGEQVTMLGESVGELEDVVESLDRRLSKLEEMAHGGF